MSKNSYQQRPESQVPPPIGCPVNRSWSPLDSNYLASPYSIASRFRDEAPLMFAERIGYLVVIRMEDIVEVFMKPEVFASTNVQDPVFPLSEDATKVLGDPNFNPIAVMSNRSEPDHGRIRIFTREGFSNQRLKQLEPYIARRSHQLIDKILDGPCPSEFVRSFAFPLPGETVFRLIGFPEKDDDLLKSWCVDRKEFSWGNPTASMQSEIAEHMLSYWKYCREFTAQRFANPTDDLASELLLAHREHPDELSYREVESVIYGLSFAGHEAVTSLIGNALLCLLSNIDQWTQICENSGLIDNAVEEVIRFKSSQISWRRITTCDTVLGGIRLKAGTPIFLNFAAANMQPNIFDDPHTFDIHRSNASRHISFGKGVHYCLGANLAKLELRVVMQALSERIPTLRLVKGQELKWFPNITFRGPEKLLVEWNK